MIYTACDGIGINQKHLETHKKSSPDPEVIKKMFMLNSTEHEIYPFTICENVNKLAF